MNIVNVTPHPLNFLSSDGSEFEVAPSGVILNAVPEAEPAGNHPSGVELVRTRFIASPESELELQKLENDNPGSVVVGSMLAAQAFPGRVLAVTPVPGYERRPPAEKRMNPERFTVF